MTPTKILIVEDERIIARDIAETLERLEYVVSAIVSSCEEALEQARLKRPDIALMDIHLKGDRDGIETARLLRDQFDLPVIYLTAYADASILERAKATEPLGYIVKPFKEHSLKTTIEMAVYKESMDRQLRAREKQLRDITEALEKSQNRYRSLLEAATQIIGTSNAQGHIVEPIPSWQTYTGQSFDDYKGVGWITAVHPDDRMVVQTGIKAAGLSKQRWESEVRLRRHDGIYRAFFTRWIPLLDAQDTLQEWVGSFADITERKRYREEIEELNSNLEKKVAERTAELMNAQAALLQAQKLEAIGQLAGGVAHDFNNLITGIIGVTEELKERFKDDAHAREEIDEILKAGTRALDVTKQLLAFGRRQMLQPVVIDVNASIKDLNKMISRLLGEDIRIELTLRTVRPIKIDRGYFDQVLLNLAINARDAMSGGGVLTMRTEDVQLSDFLDGRQIGAPAGAYVLVEVSDTGHGMSADTLSHIFEPFYTTKEKYKGSGLGLATVYGVVTQNGGDLRVTSELQKGTTFQIYFPVVDQPVADHRPVLEPSLRLPGNETVLVIEDELIVRRVVVRSLQKAGYSVLEANSGQEALQLLDTTSPAIDLVITDVIMPGLNGRETIDKIRERFPRVAVLYMSGYPQDVIAEKGKLENGLSFIEKSDLRHGLSLKVREALNSNAAPTKVS